jgi:hypothetical protein
VDFKEADFETWTKGWRDKVYTDDCANPDITLGELLLVYFEWMSKHKVPFVVLRLCFMSSVVHHVA